MFTIIHVGIDGWGWIFVKLLIFFFSCIYIRQPTFAYMHWGVIQCNKKVGREKRGKFRVLSWWQVWNEVVDVREGSKEISSVGCAGVMLSELWMVDRWGWPAEVHKALSGRMCQNPIQPYHKNRLISHISFFFCVCVFFWFEDYWVSHVKAWWRKSSPSLQSCEGDKIQEELAGGH